MFNLSSLIRGGTACFSKAGLAIATTTSRAKTAAPNGAGIDYAIGGIMYHLADADNNVIFTAATQAANTTALYLVCVDAAGAITVLAGRAIPTSSVGVIPLEFPVPPPTVCPIGAIRVASGASAFVAGTTALTGGTVTVAYMDLFAVPDRNLMA